MASVVGCCVRLALFRRVMTDTHGYTAWAMSLAKLLGFDLSPRLKSFRDRRLHVPHGFPVPEELQSVCVADISLSAIEAGWPELCAAAGRARRCPLTTRASSMRNKAPCSAGCNRPGVATPAANSRSLE